MSEYKTDGNECEWLGKKKKKKKIVVLPSSGLSEKLSRLVGRLLLLFFKVLKSAKFGCIFQYFSKKKKKNTPI